jgi:4-hydroxybenzoate polyprenyltransferase
MDKALKKIWDEFIYGGHFLAFGDALTLYAFGMILDIQVTWDFFIIIYLCVFSANLFNREEEHDTDKLTNPIRVKIMEKYVQNQKYIIPLSLFIVVFLFLTFADLKTLALAGVIFLIAIMYSVLLKRMTKIIISFKSMVAALFYALMVLLLAYYYKAPVDMALIAIFIFYYVRIYISNAYCDFKDVEGDKKKGLKTLVVYFGDKKAINILNVLNYASAIPVIIAIYYGFLPLFSLAVLLTIFYAQYYFSLNRKINQEFLSNVVIDGEFVPWVLYLVIGKILL